MWAGACGPPPQHYVVPPEPEEVIYSDETQYPLDGCYLHFRETAWMSVARTDPSATALLDGRVLVAGGSWGGTYKSAELFDPQTEAWSPAAPMLHGREFHGAFRLRNGDVLVVGGRYSKDGHRYTPIEHVLSAERYVVATGSWVSAGTLPFGLHTPMTLSELTDGRLIVFGWVPDGGPRRGVIYEPESGQWRHTALFPVLTDTLLAVTTHGDRPLVVAAASRETFLYDPNLDTFEFAGFRTSPTTGRYFETRQHGVLSAFGEERYDPLTREWSPVPVPNEIRPGAVHTLLTSDLVFTVGGNHFDGERWHGRRSAEIFDPVENRWVAVG